MNNYIYDDYEYEILVSDILNHNEFIKMKDIAHHGTTRYDHCIKVSYKSYKIAKFLKLDLLSHGKSLISFTLYKFINDELNPPFPF